MFRLKHGVNPIGIKAELVPVLLVAIELYRRREAECVVTSINDGVHSDTSRHYQGCAVDFRTKNLPSATVAREITEEMRDALGRHYLVLFEQDHIHVSYKPRKP